MSSSSRNLLHRDDVLAFAEFLSKLGYDILPLKSPYEVLRIRRPGATYVFYQRDHDAAKDGFEGSTHITVPKEAKLLVKMWVDAKRAKIT